MLKTLDDGLLTQKVILLMTGVPGTVAMHDEISQLVAEGDLGKVSVYIDDVMNNTRPGKVANNLAVDVQYILSSGYGIDLTTQKIDQLIADSFRQGVDDSWLGLFTFMINKVGGSVGKILENRAEAADSFTNLVNERSVEVDVSDPLVQDWIDKIDASNESLNTAKNTLKDLIDQLTRPPELISSAPVDEAIEIAINQNLTLFFNKAVKAGSGNIVISGSDGDIRVIPVTDSSQVVIDGRVVTINPVENLHPNTSYSVQLPKGVFKDSGNRLFAGSDDLNFNTVDSLPPELIGTAPLDNAIGVSVDQNISLTFNEKIQAGTGDIILSSDDGTDIRTIAITDGSQVTITGDTLVINPTDDLFKGKGYSVQLAAGVITDLAGNPFAGIADTTTLNFRTPSSEIIVPPPPVIVAADTPINTYRVSDQDTPSVIGLNDGGFVVTWESWMQDGDLYGTFGQRYDADGIAVGGEFQINTYITAHQNLSSIAALNDGGFVVTWQSRGQDGDGYGIFGQRYDADGIAVGGEFQINTYTANWQYSPSITALSDGGFVVTWISIDQDGDGRGIFGQRYDADGIEVGGEFQINTYTIDSQGAPSITALSDGGFVVTWQSLGQDGDGAGIFGQRYDADGIALGGEFQINTYTTDSQQYPSVAALSDGGFIVTWQSLGQDGDESGIFGQRYDASGIAVGGEFQINTYIAGSQTLPSVAALSDGGFVVTWGSAAGQDGDGSGIFGKRYDANGREVPWGGDRLFYLTTATDSLHGTSADDLFIGNIEERSGLATLQSGDNIDGGTGTDTLIAELNLNFPDPNPTISNVENIELTSLNSDGASLDLANVSGMQRLRVNGSNPLLLSNVSTSNLLSSDFNELDLDGTSDITVSILDDSLSSVFDTFNIGTWNYDGTVTLDSTGTNSFEALSFYAITDSFRESLGSTVFLQGTALSGLESIFIHNNDTTNFTLSTDALSNLKTIDASSSVGSVQLHLSNLLNNLTVVGGPGNDGIDAGSGNDRLTGGSGTDFLTGNAGDDVLEGGDDSDDLRGDGRDGPGINGQDTLIGGRGKDFIVGSYFNNDTNTLTDDFLSDRFVYAVGDSLNLPWDGWSLTTADHTNLGLNDIFDLPFDIVSMTPSSNADYTFLPDMPSTGVTADSMSNDIAAAISSAADPNVFSQQGDTIMFLLTGGSAIGSGNYRILVQNSNDNNTYDAAEDTVIATWFASGNEFTLTDGNLIVTPIPILL